MTMKYVVEKDGKYDLMTVEPSWGNNYKKGYIGFCYYPSSFFSQAIAKVTKYCNYSGINISHVLIVTGENTCIEADAPSRKVIESPLTKYFDDEKRIISFRKPRNLTDIAANEIAALAKSKVGCGYEYAQIVGHLGKSLPGIKQFNKLTHNFFVDIISCLIDNKDKFICSELAAYSLKHARSWEYRNKGILSRLTTRVNPQELFEDRVIFSDWTVNKIPSDNKTTDVQIAVK